MKSVEFCYWLQGYFEMSDTNAPMGLSPFQVEQMKVHLAMVFKHEIDLSYPKEQQADLNKLHIGPDAKSPYDPATWVIKSDPNAIYRC